MINQVYLQILLFICTRAFIIIRSSTLYVMCMLIRYTHRYEKMISGKYLGEMVRLVCHDLITKKLLCGGKMLSVFEERERFQSAYLSVIEQG